MEPNFLQTDSTDSDHTDAQAELSLCLAMLDALVFCWFCHAPAQSYNLELNSIHLSHVMRKPVYAHPHNLISAFVVHCLDRIILPVSIS